MSHVAAFVGISAIVICTPGPDTALIVRNTIFGGRTNGVRTAAGIVSGIALWTLAASAGVAAVLVWLGIATLRGHRRAEIAARPGSDYRQGLLSNLGNPKIAVFFTSLLPQFGAGFLQLAAFGMLFCAMGALWLTGYALVVARARGVMLRPRVRRALDAITGIALVAFGARLAAERG
ncbi:MAG: LysE family translocator [Actinobacteria bacterium]|nr:MAG: LysE family translocator [Actinomycetota bacterium]